MADYIAGWEVEEQSAEEETASEEIYSTTVHIVELE